MGEWKEYKLGDITTEIGDGIHGTPNYSEDGEFYFINGNNISNGKVIIKGDTKRVNRIEFEKYKKLLSNRTILLSINGTIGNVGFYNNEKCILGKSACYFNLKDNVDKNFVYYTFLTDDFQSHLLNIATGTTIQNVPLKGLRESIILLPPLDEQKRIASILSSLDDKIDLLHRENATLEAMAETLFRQWFIEEAKEDWKEGQLGDVCLYVTEKIDISNVDVDTYISTENMCPNKQGVVEASSIPENVKVTKYIQDDILLSNIRPYFKKIWLADRNGACSNDVLCIRSKSEDLKYFTYYTIRQDDFFDYVMLGAKGCKMPRGDKQHIMNWPIMIPTNDVLRRFNTIVENGMAKIRNNNKQIQVLIQTRDSLIPKLMSNEIII